MEFNALTQRCVPGGKSGVEILLVDDHLIFREGLRRLLEDEPDFSVVAHVSEPDEALRVAVELRPDILITGLSSRPLVRMMQSLQQTSGDADRPLRTIVLTTEIEKTHMVQALQLGVSGILLRDSSAQLLFESIRGVMAGECWVGRERLTSLVESLRRPGASLDRPSAKTRFGLTARELEIVASVRRGETNKAIARRYSIREDTVKHHLTRIFDKIGVYSRLELAVFAINQGLEAMDAPAPLPRA